MEYRLYGKSGICLGISDNINDAKEYFGQVYDRYFAQEVEDANAMKVEVILDKGKAGTAKFAEYSIKDFLNMEKIPMVRMEKMPKVRHKDNEFRNEIPYETPYEVPSEDSREFEERAKAFSDDEYRTVLKYVHTGFILGELMRRFDEYNKATDGIASLLDNMKIYNKE